MDSTFSTSLSIQLQTKLQSPGHPWLTAHAFDGIPELPEAASATVYTVEGTCLGSGIWDQRERGAVWRRFSQEPDIAFDETYIADAIQASLDRRRDEACQRLVDSDADYLPGLIVEIYNDVLLICPLNAAVEAYLDTILEIFGELIAPREIVIDQTCSSRRGIESDQELRTASGQNLKGFWIVVDDIAYRLDLLNAQKPRFDLDQREQHALVGSLCVNRRMLEIGTAQAGFSLQAMRQGALSARVVDPSEDRLKAIGANAQKNQLNIEVSCSDVISFLKTDSDTYDCIVLNAREEDSLAQLKRMHELAFTRLQPGGILATYCRSTDIQRETFERLIAECAGNAGRDGRLFARISQPFDFPVLLNLPETAYLKGLVLQVE